MHEVLAVAFALAALLNGAMAVLTWRRRSATPAATALAAAFASLALWSAVDVPVNFPLPRAVHAALVQSSFLGVLGAVVAMYLLSRFVADPHHRPGRVEVAHLVVVPAALLAAVATDRWHHLVFGQVVPLDGPPWFEAHLGPLFWVHAAWCYGLLAASYGHLGRAWWRRPAAVRPQVALLVLGGLVPTAGNLLVIGRPDLFSGQDLTPLFFTVTALVDARAVLHRGLLQVVPIARSAVLETLQDEVVVVDAGGTVVDVNPPGRAYLRARRPDLPANPVGVQASEFLGPRALGDLPGGHVRYELEHEPGLHLDVQVTAIRDSRGRDLGRVVIARDITELVETRRSLERLRAQLAEWAVRGPLTALHNRRHVVPTAEALVAGASGQRPVGVLVVDVDHFKRVNDLHGHAVGDEVLTEVAGALAGTVREGDVLARTGGEEFALVLPGADERTVAVRAERLRAACAALAVPVAAGGTVRPTVSVGTAVTRGGTDLARVLSAADGALYAAKAGGRDRVAAATA